MTSPLQPIVLQQEGPLAGLNEGLQALLQGLQTAQQRKQQQAEFALQQQIAGAQMEEMRVRVTSINADLENQRLAAKAQADAAKGIQDLLASGQPLTQQTIAAAVASLPKDKTGKTVELFVQGVQSLGQSLSAPSRIATEAAGARTAGAQADVATATVPQQIAAPELQNQLIAAQTANVEAATQETQLDNALQRLRQQRDPERVDRATALWRLGGLTWQAAREAAGLAPGGIAENATYTPTDPVAQSEQQGKARNFALQMIPANATVNALTREGARVSIPTAIQRAAQSNALGVAINQMQDPIQRQLLQAGLQYVMSYRFFMSGQQSSDREYLNMIKLTLEMSGDDDETIRQKRVMRQLQINAVSDVAGGQVDPVAILDDMLGTMRAEKMKPEFIAAMTRERNMAFRTKQRRAAGLGPLELTTEPTTPQTMQSSMLRADSLLQARFDTTGTRGRPSSDTN